MGPRRSRMLVVGCVVVVASAGLTGTARAEVDARCRYDAVTGELDVTVAGYPGDPAVVLDRLPTGEFRLHGSLCGGATVTNTDFVEVHQQFQRIELALALPFAPGRTPEPDGISEIEVFYVGEDLAVSGGPGADDFRRGAKPPDTSSDNGGGLHVNADADLDVRFFRGPMELVLDGRGGDDFIDGSASTSLPYGGHERSTLIGGDGDDVLRGNERNGTLVGGGGADVLVDGLGDDTVSGGDGDDTLVQAAAAQAELLASPLAVPDGGSVSSTLSLPAAGVAHDVEVRATVTASDTSALTLRLAHGGTEVVLASGLTGTGYHGTLFDDAAADSVVAGTGVRSGRFRPSGGALATTLDGPAGTPWTLTVDDATAGDGTARLVAWTLHLVASPSGAAPNGRDAVDGGAGDDVLSYATRSAPVAYRAKTGMAGELGEGDTVTGAEKVATGAGDDDVRPIAAMALDCGAGDDVVTFADAPGGVTVAPEPGCEELHGSDHADVITGTAGGDVLNGRAGNDVISAGPGDDVVSGGPGNDVLAEGDTSGANGADALHGDDGRDVLSYAGRAEGVTVRLDGVADDGATGEGDNADVEWVAGTAHADVIVGDAGPNDLSGGGGDDAVDGGGGIDWLYGGDGDDVLTGGDGDDMLFGGVGRDRFAEGGFASGADTVSGGAGIDVADYSARLLPVTVDLDDVADDGERDERDDVRFDVEDVYGGHGPDTLTGSWAPNHLFGQGGADTVTGGPGVDVLDGGAGPDLLHGRDLTTETLVGGSGFDLAEADPNDAVSGVEVSL